MRPFLFGLGLRSARKTTLQELSFLTETKVRKRPSPICDDQHLLRTPQRTSKTSTFKLETKPYKLYEDHISRVKKLEDLESLVMKEDISSEERRNDTLILLNEYCLNADFTSAKAFLLANLKELGSEGVSLFIWNTIIISYSSNDVLFAFKEYCKLETPKPEVASLALQALTYMDNSAGFEECWNLTSRFYTVSASPEIIMAKCLDAMLSQNWQNALQFWENANQLPEFKNVKLDDLFVLACRYFLLENPNLDGAKELLEFMSEIQQKPSSQFTAVVFYYMAPMYQGTGMSAWISSAYKNGWTVEKQAVLAILRLCRASLPNSKYHELFEQFQTKTRTWKSSSRDERRLWTSYEQTIINAMALPNANVIDILQQLQKNGVHLRYRVLVRAFVMCVEANQAKEKDIVVGMMKEYGYPIHCVETDLAMMEFYCRESKYDPVSCKEMIVHYLVEYPALNLNLSTLTQIGWILYNAKDYEMAIQIGDSKREQGDSRTSFCRGNHDSKSIALLLWCLFKNRKPLVPFLRGVLAEARDIYFDKTFVRKLKKLLVYLGEDLTVIEEINISNDTYMASLGQELDTIIKTCRHETN